jgi:hypothetical protein
MSDSSVGGATPPAHPPGVFVGATPPAQPPGVFVGVEASPKAHSSHRPDVLPVGQVDPSVKKAQDEQMTDSLAKDLALLMELDMPEITKSQAAKLFKERLCSNPAERATYINRYVDFLARKVAENTPPPSSNSASSVGEIFQEMGDICRKASFKRPFNFENYQEKSGLQVKPVSTLDDPEAFDDEPEGEEEAWSQPPGEAEAEAALAAAEEEAEDEAARAAFEAAADAAREAAFEEHNRSSSSEEEPPAAAPVVVNQPAAAPVVVDQPAAAPVVVDQPAVAGKRPLPCVSATAKLFCSPEPEHGNGDGTGDPFEAVGASISNTRSRPFFVLAKDNVSVEAGYKAGLEASIGFGAVASARFGESCYVLVAKDADKRSKIPTGWSTYAPTHQRKFTPEGLFNTLELFVTTAQEYKTNMFTESLEVKSGIWTPEQLQEHVKHFTKADFSLLAQHSARAKNLKYKEQPDLAPLHRAVESFGSRVEREMVERDKVGCGIVMKLDDPATLQACPLFWHEAPEYVGNMKVFAFTNNRVVRFTLGEYMSTPKHRMFSLLIIGPPEFGKSQLLHMFGKSFCIRKGPIDH